MNADSRQRLGLLAALAALWIAFEVASDGAFLTPRNLTNLLVQSCVVALMATGMVLVIAARQIDLSVGSLLGFVGMLVATLQADLWPRDAAWSGAAAALVGLLAGSAIGLAQGWWIAARGVPAFVVTLAGLLIYRGGAFLLTDGRTVAPLAAGFHRLGGGPEGVLAAPASLGVVALALLALAWLGRRARAPHRRALLLLGAALVAVLGVTTWPLREGAPWRGLPYPVLLLGGVTLAMSVIAHRTRFGRALFAMGGNPSAAERVGIPTERMLIGLFGLMGFLSALAGLVTVARLEAGASSMGTLAELSVIAAAVIGGASLQGGRGRVTGALLGALLMQSLENGLVLLGTSSAMRQIAIGAVLILAVWADGARAARRET